MADTWEQVGAAATGSSGLGSGAGAQQAQNQSWQDAGSAAAGGGQSWQDAGSGAAAGGETLGSGAGAVYRDAWAPVIATAGQGWYDKMVGAGRAATMDASGSWQSVGSSAAGGGGGTGPSGEPTHTPSTINNGTGGGSGGGGGGGGGGSNVQQPQNPKPPTTSGGSGGSGSGGAAGLLSSLLGTFGGNLMGKSTQLDSNGNQIQLPSYQQQTQQLQGLGSDTSSFGGLLSNNNQPQQQQSSSQAPQTINQAATESFNAFSGNGRAASGSPFQGGIGGVAAESGSSGTGFTGSSPSAYQQMAAQGSQGLQYQQPQADGTYSSPQNAGTSALRQQGIDSGPQMYGVPMQQPNLNVSPSGQKLNLQGQPAVTINNGIQGGVSGDESVPSLNGGSGGKSMQELVNLDAPSIKLSSGTITTQAPQQSQAKAPMELHNLDAPDIKLAIGSPTSKSNTDQAFAKEAGREAVQNPLDAARGAITKPEGDTKAKPYRVEDAFIWAGEKTGITQNVLKPLGLGLDIGLSNIAETVAYPFRTQEQRDATQRSIQRDESAMARDTAAHPYISAASKAIGEVAPYLVGGAMKGASTVAKIASSALTGGVAGFAQYAPNITDKAVNAGMGLLLGGVAGAAVPGITGAVSKVSSIASPLGLAGAVSGGYEGYKHGNGIVDTVSKVVGFGAAGYAAGKAAGATASWIAKKAAPVAKSATPVVSTATNAADDGFGQVTSKGTNAPRYLIDENTSNAPHMKSILKEQAPAKVAPPGLFDSAAERDAARRAMMKDYVPPSPPPLAAKAPVETSVAATKPGMLSRASDVALRAAAPVATVEGAQAITKQPAPLPSGNVNVPPAAPMDSTAANNKAMMAKLTPEQDVQKFVASPDPSKPMGAQLQPGAAAAIVKTMPTAKAQAIATDIMRSNPADFAKHIDSEKGRKDIYEVVKASGGDKAVAELDALLKERDGLKDYQGPNIKDAKTPLQAVQAKMDQAKYVAAQKEAAKAAKSDTKGTIQQTVKANAEAQQQAPAGAIVMGGRQGGSRSRGMKGGLNQRINALNSRIMVKVLGMMSSLGGGKGSPFYMPGSKTSTWAAKQVASRMKGYS